MRVPAEAASGVAKATLSFADWKAGNVAPTTFELNIVESDGGKLLPLKSAQDKK